MTMGTMEHGDHSELRAALEALLLALEYHTLAISKLDAIDGDLLKAFNGGDTKQIQHAATVVQIHMTEESVAWDAMTCREHDLSDLLAAREQSEWKRRLVVTEGIRRIRDIHA